MSTGTPSPPSLQSEDSMNTTSSEFSASPVPKYNTNRALESQKGISKVSAVTSHGVEDILSDGVTYCVPDNSFPDCKPEVLSSLPHSFVQDYNSRDSTGFSIQDILGLPQSYNPGNTQDTLESRYDYQIPNYETISNSSNNNYASGAEDVVSEDCFDKNGNLFTNVPVTNQVIYNRSYAPNEPTQCHQRSSLCDVVKDPGREIDNLHESSFPGQVNTKMK